MKKFLFTVIACLFAIPAFAFDESVTFSWTDPGTEDSFQVHRNASACASASANGWSMVDSPAADVLSFNDTVQDNATYCYKVRAIKDGIQGPFSAGVDIAVPASLAVIVGSVVQN